jgi:hypothetical protein
VESAAPALNAAPEGLSGTQARKRALPLAAAYAVTVFAGAFLLFQVQPMFGKMVLPLLGGSPAVWNTCMLFFQAALLGGYLWAHLTTRALGVRRQAALHLAVMLAAALALPLAVGDAAPTGGGAPIPWLLLVLLTTVGAPFMVLAGTGPILQRWFAESGSPAAANPYWLYAASNLGSLLGLLAYPFLLEPRLRIAQQSAAWAGGYALLVALVAGCAALVWRSQGADSAAARVAAADPAPVTLRQRATWVGLAFLPSSLLLGATTYLTTDLTPAPLLWVLPLALYLLTFTLVFAPRQLVPHAWMVAAQPSLLVAVVYLLLGSSLTRPAVAVPIHLAALFVTAMVCHGELSRRRPDARHLTEFYLWLSVGGVLGGIFNVLVAPTVFTETWEYPLVLVLACLARPWPKGRRSPRDHAMFALRAAGFAYALYLLTSRDPDKTPFVVLAGLGGLFVALLSAALGRAPLWLALCLGSVYVARAGEELAAARTLHADRSFFGHFRVVLAPGRDESFHVLTHGSTMHGAQSLHPEKRRDPLTYYVRIGPLGDVFATQGLSTRARRVAVVGLGAGTTAAYASENERWTFFEIDPGMERIARDPKLFTYLADSPARTRVVLGDARVSLAREVRERAPTYDLIVLDAFSSDAIPVHLLTREALGVYLQRLAPGGRIAVHTSNRYLDLEPVVASLARERGLSVRVGAWGVPRELRYQNVSTWIVLARSDWDLGMLATDARWRPAELKPGVRAWTDDHSSILDVFSW